MLDHMENNNFFSGFLEGDRVIRVDINGSISEPIGSYGTVTKVILSGECLHVKPDNSEESYLYYSKDWMNVDNAGTQQKELTNEVD